MRHATFGALLAVRRFAVAPCGFAAFRPSICDGSFFFVPMDLFWIIAGAMDHDPFLVQKDPLVQTLGCGRRM